MLIPVEAVVSRYRYWFPRKAPPTETPPETPPEPEIQQKAERPGPRRVDSTEYGATRSRKHALDNAHTKANSTARSEAPSATGTSHQIWHPPASTYDREGLPTPPYEDSDATEQEPVSQTDLNWRKYEAFPSAYPPTPMTNATELPATNHEPMEEIAEEGESAVVDEWRKYEDFPAAYPATPLPKRKKLPQDVPKLGHVREESEGDETDRRRPGFHRSLKQTHESMNPRHAGSLGDKQNKFGARRFSKDFVRDADTAVTMDIDLDLDAGEDADADADESMLGLYNRA